MSGAVEAGWPAADFERVDKGPMQEMVASERDGLGSKDGDERLTTAPNDAAQIAVPATLGTAGVRVTASTSVL